jgi:DNA mismatch repair protein MutL
MTMAMIDIFGKAGFAIREFGKNTILLEAIPADCVKENVNDLFESILEGFKSGTEDGKTKLQIRAARSMAKSLAVFRKTKLEAEEMEAIIEQLFACKVPNLTPDGFPTMIFLSFDELNNKFK